MTLKSSSDSAQEWDQSWFTPDLESLFQEHYYTDVRGMLRVAAILIAVLSLAYVARDYMDTHSFWEASRANGAPCLFCLLIFALTNTPRFGRFWQPFIIIAGWLTAALALSGTANFFATHPVPGSGTALYAIIHLMPPELLFYSQQACILMICFSALRLPFKPSVALQAGALSIAAWVYWVLLLSGAGGKPILMFRFFQPTLMVICVVLLVAYVQERLARRAFKANYLLDQERNDERRKRENTEATLKVLNRAIGGVVHDLGNPLASVQTGSQTLLMMLEEEGMDKESIKEVAEIICDGGEMLDYLRLSLIEQTRLLEGKPVPVEYAPASLRGIVEAGARYQKPRFAAGRVISIIGDEIELNVDRMKLVTVFMNLIGNSLKYSDGEVRTTWKTENAILYITVMDEGTAGKGLTEAQARQLFVAFGRLETHSGVEGIGLGLLSVQRIVEAHGGEIFIEGTSDGLPESPYFSTAYKTYPPILKPPFRTSFVIAYPLPTAD
jgi:signal transduction histidine kinase